MKKCRRESQELLEKIKEWVPKCNSHKQVADKVGSTTSVVWTIINRNKIDYSHFFRIRKGHNSRYLYKGKDFGRLHVEWVFSKQGMKKELFYCNCSCKCGKKNVIKYLDELIQGFHYCCGCTKKNRLLVKESIFAEAIGELNDKRFLAIQQNAKRANRDFLVTKEYIWDIYLQQDKKCALSGVPISFGTKAKSDPLTTASLDRIDSEQDYIEGNVQWIHKDIQRMKMDLKDPYFVFLCSMVSENKKGKSNENNYES